MCRDGPLTQASIRNATHANISNFNNHQDASPARSLQTRREAIGDDNANNPYSPASLLPQPAGAGNPQRLDLAGRADRVNGAATAADGIGRSAACERTGGAGVDELATVPGTLPV